MAKKEVLKSLMQTQDDQNAMEELVGMVVINDELLHQVGGASSGYICTISAECWGFSCALR